MKNVVLLPKLQGALSSAALGGEAALSLALPPRPPAGAKARFGGHGPPRWRAPAVQHHASAGTHNAAGAAGPPRAPVAAPHVPALVTSAASSFTLTHRSGLLLLHVQTHLAPEHDGLGRSRRRGRGRGGSLAASQGKVLNRTSYQLLLLGSANKSRDVNRTHTACFPN